jgi:hypothetical protein
VCVGVCMRGIQRQFGFRGVRITEVLQYFSVHIRHSIIPNNDVLNPGFHLQITGWKLPSLYKVSALSPS